MPSLIAYLYLIMFIMKLLIKFVCISLIGIFIPLISYWGPKDLPIPWSFCIYQVDSNWLLAYQQALLNGDVVGDSILVEDYLNGDESSLPWFSPYSDPYDVAWVTQAYSTAEWTMSDCVADNVSWSCGSDCWYEETDLFWVNYYTPNSTSPVDQYSGITPICNFWDPLFVNFKPDTYQREWTCPDESWQSVDSCYATNRICGDWEWADPNLSENAWSVEQCDNGWYRCDDGSLCVTSGPFAWCADWSICAQPEGTFCTDSCQCEEGYAPDWEGACLPANCLADDDFDPDGVDDTVGTDDDEECDNTIDPNCSNDTCTCINWTIPWWDGECYEPVVCEQAEIQINSVFDDDFNLIGYEFICWVWWVTNEDLADQLWQSYEFEVELADGSIFNASQEVSTVWEPHIWTLPSASVDRDIATTSYSCYLSETDPITDLCSSDWVLTNFCWDLNEETYVVFNPYEFIWQDNKRCSSTTFENLDWNVDINYDVSPIEVTWTCEDPEGDVWCTLYIDTTELVCQPA